MDYQGSDPQNGSSPKGPRVEDDFVRSLRPAKIISHRRLPAALPFAVAGVLVVASIAFGATVVRSIVTPTSSATPVLVGDDDPTDTPLITATPVITPSPVITDAPVITDPPTENPTATPTASPTPPPTQAPVITKAPVITPKPVVNAASLGDLHVTDNGGGNYTFCWSAYTGGTTFNYYKLSGVAYPSAPGYAETGNYWTYVSPGTTCASYKVPNGSWNVNVEAIYYPDGKTTALARTSTIKLCVSGPALTAPPVTTLTLRVDSVDPMTASHTKGVHLSWTAYTGPYLSLYGLQRVEGTGTPTLTAGQDPWQYFNPGTTSFTDTSVQAGHTYTYKLWAYSEDSFGNVVPNCTVVTILAVSNTVSPAVPAATPPPTATPTPTPTPTPVVTPSPVATDTPAS